MKNRNYIFLFTAIFLLLSACFAPLGYKSGDTTLSVGFGGGSAAISRTTENPSGMRYELVYSGPGDQTITEYANWGETKTVHVRPGHWNINVRAFDPAEPAATVAVGVSSNINVRAGQNNSVSVQMAFTIMEAIAPYLAWASGGTQTNPVSLHLALPLTGTNWNSILTALENAGKFVNLNLSACTTGDPSGGGLRIDGSFDPLSSVPTGKSRVVSLTLPNTALSIVDGTSDITIFSHFTNLNTFHSGNSVISIGDFTFIFLNLTSVTIGNSVTFIGEAAFNFNNLTSVTIGNSVTFIGAGAFALNNLTSVTIPNSVTFIGEGAFATSNLSGHLTIPNSVTSIEDYTFINNYLTSVTIPNSVVFIGSWAFSYNNLTSVTIPNSVTFIGEEAFRENNLSGHLTIPNSVTFIDMGAFSINNLTSVTIGNSVTSIGEYVFVVNQLTSVTFLGTGVTTFGMNAFGMTGNGNLPTLYSDNGAGTYTRPSADDTTWTYIGPP